LQRLKLFELFALPPLFHPRPVASAQLRKTKLGQKLYRYWSKMLVMIFSATALAEARNK
jgi:hypothetical protein